MIIDETNFIKEIKNRNIQALNFIVDKYSNLVFKVAHSVLNSGYYAQHTEECASDVFFSVWNNIESFDDEKGNFKYWITAIAKYKAIDYKRKLSKLNTSECIDDFILSDETNIENSIIEKEKRKELLEVLEMLSTDDREIFIRRYFLSETIDEIAKSFNVDRNIIDKRLSRGRKQLKSRLLHFKWEVI